MSCISYEFMQIVRVLLQDQARTLYSDETLKELIATSARLVMQDITFDNDYTVSILQRSIDPDPFTLLDHSFINLVSLKAACLQDMGDLKIQARTAGVKITQDRSVIDTSGRMDAFKILMDMGWCKAYATAKEEHINNSGNIAGQAIFSVIRDIDGFPSNYRSSCGDCGSHYYLN